MENYKAGDKVFIQDFYTSIYSKWGKEVLDKEATVVSAKQIKVHATSIGKDERAIFHAKYGVKDEYVVWQLLVELNGKKYLVSDLGFSKERRTKFSKISPGVGSRKTDI